MKKFLSLVLALALICTACVALADKNLTFKLAENQPEGNPITDGMYKFAELAKEYTNGTVTIDVYPNGALTDEASSVDQLQLGSLKVLGGTPIWEQKDQFGIVYRDKAPYEVICTEQITAEELSQLHMIENMLDIYYNRGGFSRTIEYLVAAVGKTAFGFYEALSNFYYDTGYQHRNRKKEDQYRILRQFAYTLGEETGREAEILLGEDLAEQFNEEEQKRFYKKGWEVTI